MNFYYDCKHLIVLIIGTIRDMSLCFNNHSLVIVINGNNQVTAEFND